MIAVCQRRMQFCAGPETHIFTACEEHAAQLEAGDVSCFLVIASEPVRETNPDDELSCYFCQEGGY